MWALLEDWWPGVLEGANLASWQVWAGQKVLLPMRPAVGPRTRELETSSGDSWMCGCVDAGSAKVDEVDRWMVEW